MAPPSWFLTGLAHIALSGWIQYIHMVNYHHTNVIYAYGTWNWLSKLCSCLSVILLALWQRYGSHSDIVDCKVSCKNDQENENNSHNHYHHPYEPGYVHCSRKREVQGGERRERDKERMRERERANHKGLPTILILTLTLKRENGRGSVLSWVLNHRGTYLTIYECWKKGNEHNLEPFHRVMTHSCTRLQVSLFWERTYRA